MHKLKRRRKKRGRRASYTQLIIRGVILINGTGAPPFGPVDIVIEKNRIMQIAGSADKTKLQQGGKELDCKGMYVMPGLIDMHGYIGGEAQGTPAEYVFKLWMAHGITTIRDPGTLNGLGWTLDEKRLSAENKITAPRIFAYTVFGQGANQPIITAKQAVE